MEVSSISPAPSSATRRASKRVLRSSPQAEEPPPKHAEAQAQAASRAAAASVAAAEERAAATERAATDALGTPDLSTMTYERELRRVATRGVAALFTAIALSLIHI